jgi:acyl dehydratase
LSDVEADAFRASLDEFIGKPLGSGGPSVAPDEVNLPMIRHWVDALSDANPVYLDAEAAAASRFGGIVAPPAMLQTWTMARPLIEGIAERGGSPVEIDPANPLRRFDAEGYVATLATNSTLEFERYLRLGDRITAANELSEISERKSTGIGAGYFVTWVTTYTDQDGETVGRQVFRVLKFKPGLPEGGGSKSGKKKAPPPEPTGEKLPPFDLNVTSTRIVAGAIASRDFMPVHHDPEYARSQGAPDMFMNILTTNGYVSRYVTDWAGPESRVRRIDIKLGAPAIPGKVLHFTGQVASETREGDERVLEVAVKAANELGPHATGTVVVSLPA